MDSFVAGKKGMLYLSLVRGALGRSWQTQQSSLTEVPTGKSHCSLFFSGLRWESAMQKSAEFF